MVLDWQLCPLSFIIKINSYGCRKEWIEEETNLIIGKKRVFYRTNFEQQLIFSQFGKR